MNTKLLYGLLLAGALSAAAFFYYSAGQKNAELTALRAEVQELRQAQAGTSDQQKTKDEASGDELARLRRDSEELLKLRNEVRQLRQEKGQLGQQVQAAQTQAQQAQAAAETAQAQAQAAQVSAAQAAAAQSAQPGSVPQGLFTKEQLQFRQRYGMTLDPAAALNLCVNNLRALDGAKQQWALENKKTETTVPQASDLAPYLHSPNLVCPLGGTYSLNAVSAAPTCSQPGHALGK